MNKLFIDCGAHCGCSRRKVRGEFSDYDVISFEPNSNMNKYCDKLINKAVWISNGNIDFYELKGLSAAGSSILKKKAEYTSQGNINAYTVRSVECIDLSELIYNNKDKEVIDLKLDVEGAEYTILPQLISTKAINLISTLYIEWHYKRCGVTKEFHDNLVSSIKTPIVEWSGMKKDYCIKHMGEGFVFPEVP